MKARIPKLSLSRSRRTRASSRFQIFVEFLTTPTSIRRGGHFPKDTSELPQCWKSPKAFLYRSARKFTIFIMLRTLLQPFAKAEDTESENYQSANAEADERISKIGQ